MRNFLVSLTIVIAFLAVSGMGQPEVIVQHRVNDHSQGIHEGYAPTAGSTSATSALIYHNNGPVINTPNIYLIWYGHWNQTNGTDDANGQDIIRAWARGIGGTDYLKINAGYGGPAITGNAYYAGEAIDNGTATRLSDNDILAIVDRTISAGKLPYDADGVYFVVTSSDIAERSGFCTRYCGWHTKGNRSNGQKVRYSFVGNAARCLSSCAAQSVSPNGNAGIDGSISVLSHELEEAMTDPDLNAWYDSSGSENADKCAWTFGKTTLLGNGSYANMSFGGRNWLIQRNLWKSGSSWFCALTNLGSQTGTFAP